jgi:Zn-dependent protease
VLDATAGSSGVARRTSGAATCGRARTILTVADRAPALRLLGFPITIQPGFILGLLLLGGLNAYDPAFAIRLVIALAVFLVVHELGHAVVARHYGADASISLTFLVGYAMYRPSRPLSKAERVAISGAGPLAEIVLGALVLVALGANPLHPSQLSGDPLLSAIWWAGPFLGLLNLLPLLPLDGGHIVSLGMDSLAPGRGQMIVQYWTVAACVAACLAVAVSPTWRPWALTVGLFTVWSFQALAHERRARTPVSPEATQRIVQAAQQSERQAWTTGRPGLFPPGLVVSPWYRAYVLHQAGRDESAKRLLLEALSRPAGAWMSPIDASPEQLLPLVELLPADAPVDQLRPGIELQWALHRTGYLRRSAEYGIRLYTEHQLSFVAHQVACDLALLGDAEAAMRWLWTAHGNGQDLDILDRDPDLASLRGRADFRALRAHVAERAAGPAA